jgi:hypothetical protein
LDDVLSSVHYQLDDDYKQNRLVLINQKETDKSTKSLEKLMKSGNSSLITITSHAYFTKNRTNLLFASTFDTKITN